MSENLLIVNIGCGSTPTPGAMNLDNSFSVALGEHPKFCRLLRKIHLISQDQMEYAFFCKNNGIIRADCFSLPLPDHSADVIYTSHMLEHLPKEKLPGFFREVIRVLKPEGFFRIAMPDTRILIEQYEQNGDCDELIERLLLSPQTGTFSDRLRLILLGHRGHHWMYDAESLASRLKQAGFKEIMQLSAGETKIPFQTHINLKEREKESFYIECRTPKK